MFEQLIVHAKYVLFLIPVSHSPLSDGFLLNLFPERKKNVV